MLERRQWCSRSAQYLLESGRGILRDQRRVRRKRGLPSLSGRHRVRPTELRCRGLCLAVHVQCLGPVRGLAFERLQPVRVQRGHLLRHL